MSTLPAESMEARAEGFRTAYEKVKAEIGKVIVGHDEIVHGVLDLPVYRRACPARRGAGAGQDAARCGRSPRRSSSTSTGFNSPLT